jgi:hypothetical protein
MVCGMKIPGAPAAVTCTQPREHPGRCEATDPRTAAKYTYPSPNDWGADADPGQEPAEQVAQLISDRELAAELAKLLLSDGPSMSPATRAVILTAIQRLMRRF